MFRGLARVSIVDANGPMYRSVSSGSLPKPPVARIDGSRLDPVMHIGCITDRNGDPARAPVLVALERHERRLRHDAPSTRLDRRDEPLGHLVDIDLGAHLARSGDRRDLADPEPEQPVEPRPQPVDQALLPDPIAAGHELFHDGHVGCRPDRPAGHPHRAARLRALLDHEHPRTGLDRRDAGTQPGHPATADEDIDDLIRPSRARSIMPYIVDNPEASCRVSEEHP